MSRDHGSLTLCTRDASQRCTCFHSKRNFYVRDTCTNRARTPNRTHVDHEHMTAIFTIFLNIKIANKVSLYEKHCKKRFQRKQTKSIPFCTKPCHLNSSPTKCVTTNRSQQTNKIHIQCTVSECTITFTINIYTTKNI